MKSKFLSLLWALFFVAYLLPVEAKTFIAGGETVKAVSQDYVHTFPVVEVSGGRTLHGPDKTPLDIDLVFKFESRLSHGISQWISKSFGQLRTPLELMANRPRAPPV